MRKGWIIGLLLVEALAHGQGFNRQYDASGLQRSQVGWGVERTSGTHHVIFSGSSEVDTLGPDSAAYYTAIFLMKLDGIGDTIWQRKHFLPFHGIYNGWANCCDTVEAGFVVGGGRQSFDGTDEVYLMRFGPTGDTNWTKAFGGVGEFWAGRQVKATPDGGFIIVGDTDANGSADGFALKTDSLGNEEWRQIYPGGGTVDIFIAVDMAPGGGYYLGGQKRLSFDDDDLWVVRIGPTGAVQWQRSWGSAFAEVGAHLVTLSNGNTLVASAWCYSTDDDTYRFYMAELDANDGTTVWEQQYGPVAFGSFLFAAKELPNGDLISCGTSWMSFDQQGVLMRTTATGDSLWLRTYFYEDTLFTNGEGRFYDVLPTDDGGFIMAGATYGPANAPYPPGYSQDTWVVKVDSMGCIVPGCDGVGVQELVTNLGNSLAVFPNPAHGSTTAQVQLPQSMRGKALRLVLVNAQGQMALEQTATEGSNSLDLSGLAAGLYFVHLANATTWLGGTKLIIE